MQHATIIERALDVLDILPEEARRKVEYAAGRLLDDSRDPADDDIMAEVIARNLPEGALMALTVQIKVDPIDPKDTRKFVAGQATVRVNGTTFAILRTTEFFEITIPDPTFSTRSR